jgi:hypothetical protein
MPEDSPGAFSLYVDWLYRGKVPMSNTEAHLKHLYELYFLANKLCLIELKDKTMDTIQDMAKKYDLKDELIKPSLLVTIIQNTPTRIEGLRRFCIFQLVWVYLSRWSNIEGGDYDDDKDDDQHPQLMRRDANAVFRICTQTDDCRFLESFLNHLIWIVADGVNSDNLEQYDPRTRYEGVAVDRCCFHCHYDDVNCRPSKGQADDIFIPDEENSITPTSQESE